MQYPKRIETVHAEILEGELCLYDWQRMEVHNLNPTAARVWELCDGQTTPQQIAAQLHGDLTPAQAEELVWLSLKRLEQAHLLETKVIQPTGRKVLTRRGMLKGLGVAAMMLPVVSSIVAPSPVAAQSGGGGLIVRTANVGTTDATRGWQYFAFNEGPITDAQITASGITSISYAWTGDPSSASTWVWLANANNVDANNFPYFVGPFTSPQGPFSTAVDPIFAGFWTGNRPYNGVDIESDGIWNAGVLTLTLA